MDQAQNKETNMIVVFASGSGAHERDQTTLEHKPIAVFELKDYHKSMKKALLLVLNGTKDVPVG